MTRTPQTGIEQGGMERHRLTAADGHGIAVTCWSPRSSEPPAATVQILHGLSEHLGRYQRFADACRDYGFAVVGHDHRGHGAGYAPDPPGHFADRGGWSKVVNDATAVQKFGLRRWPGVPLVLFGHSMGSYIAQSVAAREPGNIAALILSASTLSSRAQVRAGRLLALFAIARSGGRHHSPWLHQLGFGNFNRRFEPARTPVDWLTRDEAEVDKNIADPCCGLPLSNRLWYDLLGGLLEVTAPRTLRGIRADMPILVTGGQDDPVGGRHGMARLAQALEDTDHGNVTLEIWPGGRHEMLNEINRDEFTRYLLQWITRAIEAR